jgi:hypothetical protein
VYVYLLLMEISLSYAFVHWLRDAIHFPLNFAEPISHGPVY